MDDVLDRPRLPADPDARRAVYDLERDVEAVVGGPLSPSLNGVAGEAVYLARSWLTRILTHVRVATGETTHLDTLQWSRERYLAAICNRLDLEYERLHDADPREELSTVRDALVALDGGRGRGRPVGRDR